MRLGWQPRVGWQPRMGWQPRVGWAQEPWSQRPGLFVSAGDRPCAWRGQGVALPVLGW